MNQVPKTVPPPARQVLVTAHRRENFGQPLEQICQALHRLAEAYRERLELVWPVHLNPQVQEPGLPGSPEKHGRRS